MSIAVSAVVRPSAFPRLALGILGACALAAALTLARAGGTGFRLALPGASLSVFAALFCLLLLCQNRKPCRIDISGVGQIRLTVYQDMGAAQAVEEVRCSGARLLPASTLWPGVLFLRLRLDSGAIAVLPVWPGSVVGAAFRALAVACRALAARHPGVE